MPTFGSLFAGIGGFDLGLERAGWECRWQVEIDPFCQRVLAKHWPDVARYGDVRAVASETCALADPRRGNGDGWAAVQAGNGVPDWKGHADGAQAVGAAECCGCRSCIATVDLICGGFPCQPVSVAGKRLAQADERWLWPEFARVVRALRPRFVLVENVPGLLVRGFGDVVGDLATCGYDAEWDCIPASAVGAPHRRDRVWLVARHEGSETPDRCGAVGDADKSSADPYAEGRGPRRAASEPGWWATEPSVGRVAHGVPARVDRLRSLGNAIVPQVAEWIGRRLRTMTTILSPPQADK